MLCRLTNARVRYAGTSHKSLGKVLDSDVSTSESAKAREKLEVRCVFKDPQCVHTDKLEMLD